MYTRRTFLYHTSSIALGFSGLRRLSAGDAKSLRTRGYGPLIADRDKILDLPGGFSYEIIGRAGETMSDGLILPGSPDGMAAFPGKGDEVVVVRNHEVSAGSSSGQGAFGRRNELLNKINKDRFYDSGKNLHAWAERAPSYMTPERKRWSGNFSAWPGRFEIAPADRLHGIHGSPARKRW